MLQEDTAKVLMHLNEARKICGKYINGDMRDANGKGFNYKDAFGTFLVLNELADSIMYPRKSFTENDDNDVVIQFINDFYDNIPTPAHEFLRMEFKAGYCYYFACMLEKAFPGGVIVWCAPFGHIAYQINGKVYDVEGEYAGEADFFIPISYLGDDIRSFMHIPDDNCLPDEERRNTIIDKYRIEHRDEYKAMLQKYKTLGASQMREELGDYLLRQCYYYLIDVPKTYTDITHIVSKLYTSLVLDEFNFIPYSD